jgi:hypothetical protein
MHLDAILAHPAFWVVVAAASEIIGMSSMKDNSVIQMIFTMLKAIDKRSKKRM